MGGVSSEEVYTVWATDSVMWSPGASRSRSSTRRAASSRNRLISLTFFAHGKKAVYRCGSTSSPPPSGCGTTCSCRVGTQFHGLASVRAVFREG